MSTTSPASDSANALRAAQKPLKDKYRSDPQSALVRLTSTGTLDPTSVTCSLSNATASKRIAGLHAAAGGAGPDVSQELCSGDMLLESLVACFGVTVRAVSTSMGIPVASGTITAEGELDFRGTLGVKAEDGAAVAVGFQKITLHVRLDVGEEHKSQVDKLISLSERYCVVLQTLRNGVAVTTKVGHVGRTEPDTRDNVELAESNSAESRPQKGSSEPQVSDSDVLPVN